MEHKLPSNYSKGEELMMSTSAWRGSPMKLFMLFCLFIISVFLLILRTIWLYNPPFMWFVYQLAHLMLFGLCI
jgi:hypothetical protein